MKNYRVVKAQKGFNIERKLTDKEALLISGNSATEVYDIAVSNIEDYIVAENIAKNLACANLCVGDVVMEF